MPNSHRAAKSHERTGTKREGTTTDMTNMEVSDDSYEPVRGERTVVRLRAPETTTIEEFHQSLENKSDQLVSQTRKLKHAVQRFYPDAWKVVEAALAVVATGLLADNDKCIALILVGLSGVGKTLPLSCIMPGKTDKLYERFYRSDKFTAASFVSHRADQNKEQLGEIDLLPRIKDKTLVTPELTPLFRGKLDE